MCLAETRLTELQQEAVSLARQRQRIEEHLKQLRLEEATVQERQREVSAAIALAKSRAGDRIAAGLKERARNACVSLGYPAPRDFQLDAPCSLLSGNDVSLIYPAGAGKSLAALLVGALSATLVLVVVPLLALAEQLCAQANAAFGVDPQDGFELSDGSRRPVAVALGGSSAANYDERIGEMPQNFHAKRMATLHGHKNDGLCEVLAPDSQLSFWLTQLQKPSNDGIKRPFYVFLSPEKLMLSLETQAFVRKAYELGLLKYILLDEVHCVVDHGLDFRPEYLELGLVRAALPELRCLLFTATASPATLAAICTYLSIDPGRMHSLRSPTGSLRAQMTYVLLPVATTGQRQGVLDELLYRNRDRCGIIYCTTQRQCELLAAREATLRRCGIVGADGSMGWQNGDAHVAYFHAGIPTRTGAGQLDKACIQTMWNNGEIDVLFATIAFGMGVDKPDVHFVYHISIPKSIPAYYQEVSRAGRNGQPATGLLLWNITSWIAAAQQRAGGVSAGTEGREVGLVQMIELLRLLLDSSTCPHRRFEDSLGDSTASHLCSCSATHIPVEDRCQVCLGAPFDVNIKRSEWMPTFVASISAVCRRVVRVSRSISSAGAEVLPTAGQVLRAWRSTAQKRGRPQWLADLLFGHAVVSGVLTLGTREKVHKGDGKGLPPPQVGGRRRSSSYWLLTATIDSGGRMRAASAPELGQLSLRSSCFDPALGGGLLARSARIRQLEIAELSEEIGDWRLDDDQPDPSDEDSLNEFLDHASDAVMDLAADEASVMVLDLEIEEIAAEMQRHEQHSECEALMAEAEGDRLAAEEAKAEAEAAAEAEAEFWSTDEEADL